MKKVLSKNYEGMGFAEALIALMISGMVGIVLMRISASTLRELAQLDMQDAIAQYAVSTSVDLQRIAIEDIERDDKEFDSLMESDCYGIKDDGTAIVDGVSCSERGTYTLIPGTDYFRIFKVISKTPQKVILEIRTGSSKMLGEHTSSRDIKDYRYLVTIVR